MRSRLSKSRFLVGHQCHRRLWLEVHERNALELGRSVADQAILDHGRYVGEVARSYFPGGVLIDIPHTEPERRVQATREAIEAGAKIIYEASFFESDIFVAVDVLHKNGRGWTLTEVKSTTSVKDEHLLDAAVQAHVLGRSGLSIQRVELMHLNRECTYPDLSNLFRRENITSDVDELLPAIPKEAKRQLTMLQGPLPDVEPGDHCFEPYECPFLDRCTSPGPEHHIGTLYQLRAKKAAELMNAGYETIDELPDDIALNAVAERQRRAVQEGRMIVEPGLGAALGRLKAPVAYLDFETLCLPIPCWSGCHPYDQVPVQFSVLHESGRQRAWIADGPDDPREELARALIDATKGPQTIAAYNSSFEKRCIEHLANNVPRLAQQLDGVIDRLVDVLPMVREHVYHPDFGGGFSLKVVHPALVGRDAYAGLDVADGGAASAELEQLMFDESLDETERRKIKAALVEYCGMDTRALMEVAVELRKLSVR